MEKRLEPLEIKTTNEGAIELIQDDFDQERIAVIRISPDQVDVVIDWLKQAKAELHGKKAPTVKPVKLEGV